MGIDFSSLVLAPAMATFAKPVLVTPLASQPNAAPYSARGIWTVQEHDDHRRDGNTFSTVNLVWHSLGDYPADRFPRRATSFQQAPPTAARLLARADRSELPASISSSTT
jgi:hypothetical protein